MKVYPIKFNPIFKEKIWGGNKLKDVLSKNTSKHGIGESWEISDVEGDVSEVSNGFYKGCSLKDLMRKYGASIIGVDNFENFGHNFPLLIKFLDAKTDLSVQVHPDDEMANKYHNSFGKTEMWYIMDSDKDANIVLGLKDESINPHIFNHITADNVDSIFHREKVDKGDSFFIPAGKIHAIGAGVLAAEIQQTSDITYRVYDWDRRDDKGHKRELHTKLAEKATKKFSAHGKASYTLQTNESANLVNCDYFTTNILSISNRFVKDYSHLDSFVIYMCVEGVVELSAGGVTEIIKMGETILLPAVNDEVRFNSFGAKLLEIYIDTNSNKRLLSAS